jgi:hypothetical protein
MGELTMQQSILGAVAFSIGISVVASLAMYTPKKIIVPMAENQNSIPIGRKGDTEKIAYAPSTHIVRTIPISVKPTEPPADDRVVEPVSAPAPAVEEPVSSPADSVRRHRRSRYHHDGDICKRHGMHKVETNHGRSWRCAK